MKKQIIGRASAILPTATAALLALLAATTASHAQTATTWTSGGGTADWNNASNWSAGVPVAGFNAIFGANVGGDPNQYYTLAMDKITFAAGFSAGHTLQFGGATGGWNVNTAGTFIEVQATNSGAQQLNVSRNTGQPITLQSGTSTILNNGSGGLTVGSSIASGGGKIQSASGLNSTLVVDGSGTTTIGPISGGGFTIADNGAGVLSLTKNGTGGALNLSGDNTFSGGLTLQGTGAINLSHSNAAGTGTIFLNYASSSFVAKTLGISGGITVANAIQIDSTTGREAIVSSGTGNNSLTGGITITGAGSNSIFFANEQSSGNLTVSGGISGASYNNIFSLRGTQVGNTGFLNGPVTLAANAFFDNNGSTSWTLNTAGSTWGQTLARSSGNLILGANDALATGARVVFDVATSTGGVDLNGFNQTVAGVETTVTPTSGNGGRITNGGSSDSVLTLAGLSADRTFAGTITDGPTNKVSLVMNSSGRTQTLNGANTYTGNTTVSAGTLLLGTAGSIANSGTISVASGATLNVSAVSGGWALGSSQTLKGSGTVAGNATINGNLQPGSSPGLLSFDSNLTLAPTANTTMEINGSVTRGTDFDGINVTSALVYDGTLTLAVGTTFGEGTYSFNLFDFGSQSSSFDAITLSGNYTGSLSGPGNVWSLTSGVNTWTFTHSTGDLGLTVIPEPSTWALLAGSLGILMVFRRRRH
jgi:autotransporter-associated beta strand protein